MTQETQTVIAFVEIHVFGGELHLGGYVLRWRGKWMDQEHRLQGADLEQWLIYDIPPASSVVMVWEGVCENEHLASFSKDWEPRFHGEWRTPTVEELQSLAQEPPR
jgi:hypothetical protein